MRRETTSQQAAEHVHGAADEIRELLEKWQDRITLDNLRLVKRYLEGEVRLLVHVDWLGEKYCAVFDGKAPDGRDVGGTAFCAQALNTTAADNSEVGVNASHTRRGECHGGGQEQSVFVSVIETTQGPQVVRAIAFIRLDRIDRIHRLLPHALYFSHANGFVFVGVERDGESGVVGLDASVIDDERTNDVIERAPQILDNFSDAEREGVVNTANGKVAELTLRGLQILLFNDSVVVRPLEGIDELFKVDDVLFGPFDFQAGAR